MPSQGPMTVVLHSGGLDSTVCLLLAREAGPDILSLGIDHGQRNRIELEYARNQCERWAVPRRVLRVEWDKPSRPLPTDRSVEEIRQGGVSPAFLPGRNLVFLALACAQASSLGAQEVWIGINSIDYSGYPDCRPTFLDAFKRISTDAFPGGPTVKAPLLTKTKPEIATEALRLGLKRGETWSCYTPTFSLEGLTPCGRCDACVLHDYAWREALTTQRSAYKTS